MSDYDPSHYDELEDRLDNMTFPELPPRLVRRPLLRAQTLLFKARRAIGGPRRRSQTVEVDVYRPLVAVDGWIKSGMSELMSERSLTLIRTFYAGYGLAVHGAVPVGSIHGFGPRGYQIVTYRMTIT